MQDRTRLRAASAAVAFSLLASADVRADVSWTNSAGGNFTAGSNWNTGTPPAATDTAAFDLASTYAVRFPGDGATQATAGLNVGRGNVTFNIRNPGGYYGFYDSGPTVIGSLAGQSALLTVVGGYLGTPNASTVDLAVGAAGAGTLNVRQGSGFGGYVIARTAAIGSGSAGVVNLGLLTSGNADFDSGALYVEGDAYVGGSSAGAGTGGGTVNVGRGGQFRVRGTGTTTLYAGGTVNLFRGGNATFETGVDAQGGTIAYGGGYLYVGQGDLTVGNGGAIQTDVSVAYDNQFGGDQLYVAGALTLDGKTLTLDGGSLTAGSLANPNGGKLVFNSGYLNLTTGGVTLDTLGTDRPLGDALTLAAGSRINVGGKLVVGDTNHGSFSADGYNTNAGSSGSLAIAAKSGSTGTFALGGTQYVQFNVNGDAYVGGDDAGSGRTAGGTGAITLDNGAYLAISGDLVLFANGSVTMADGATLSIYDNLDNRGGTLTYNGGVLNYVNGPTLTVGTGSSLDQDIELTSGRQLNVNKALVAAGRTITVDGGQLSGGTFAVTGSGRFIFNSGTLYQSDSAATNTLTANAPLGATLSVNAGDSVQLYGTTTIASDGSLNVAGGNFYAAALVNDSAAPVNFTSGQFQLGSDLAIDTLGPNRSFGNNLAINSNRSLSTSKLVVGDDASGTLVVDGGSINSYGLSIAARPGSTGVVTVGGNGNGGTISYGYNASLDVGGDNGTAGGTATPHHRHRRPGLRQLRRRHDLLRRHGES